MKRIALGTTAALATMALLTLAMIPLRPHLSVATTALILVVPVVIGVVIGGFVAGVISVIAGFLVYDFFFIPPYLTFLVGASQNWAALGVYALVMLPVARVVAAMNAARSTERRHAEELSELFGISGMLIEDRPIGELLNRIVATLADLFAADNVAVFLGDARTLSVAACVGVPLGDEQARELLAATRAGAPARSGLVAVPLVAGGRSVGLLTLSGEVAASHGRSSLQLFANQVALAVERQELREQALKARLTQEVERLARILVAAVSHDLRTPLAAIKASSSTLADAGAALTDEARVDLALLIDAQADRLTELVANLLDMSRIHSGVLTPLISPTNLSDLVDTVLADLAPALASRAVIVDVSPSLPEVAVDPVLMTRVIANLLTNAARYSPAAAPITISARGDDDHVLLTVTDRGPGIRPERRDEVFGLMVRRSGDTGSGLGLAIAKTFVEAHGQDIWVDDAPGGGARFTVSLQVAAASDEEVADAPRAGR